MRVSRFASSVKTQNHPLHNRNLQKNIACLKIKNYGDAKEYWIVNLDISIICDDLRKLRVHDYNKLIGNSHRTFDVVSKNQKHWESNVLWNHIYALTVRDIDCLCQTLSKLLDLVDEGVNDWLHTLLLGFS